PVPLLQPKCPADLETICLKGLHKEIRHRYASALELADDLGRFLRGEPITARPAAAWERAAKWARRRPAQAALVAATVLAVVAGMAGGVFYGLYKDQQAAAAGQLVAAQEERFERRLKVGRLKDEGQEAE